LNHNESGWHPREAKDPAIGNPVCMAFQLGWDMSCLYHQAHTEGDAPKFQIVDENGRKTYPKLPAQGDFTASQRTERRIVAVSAGLYRLSAALERSGFQAPSMEGVSAAFAGEDGDALKEEAYELHVTTLMLLQASDPRLGSAFNLGRALMATGSASSATELKAKFQRHRINGLRDELHDLVSALPGHVGSSVATSLCWWQCALEPKLEGLQEGDSPRLAKRLDRQAELWRALLSGEKHGPDMLEATDYTAAAGRLLSHAGSIVRTALKGRWIPILIALATIVGLIALAVGVGGVSGTLAALAGIAAAFGISWRGTGATIGALAARLQGPLWGAELDRAIAMAITDRKVRRAYKRLPPERQRCRIPS
jgi:hypothetical protein